MSTAMQNIYQLVLLCAVWSLCCSQPAVVSNSSQINRVWTNSHFVRVMQNESQRITFHVEAKSPLHKIKVGFLEDPLKVIQPLPDVELQDDVKQFTVLVTGAGKTTVTLNSSAKANSTLDVSQGFVHVTVAHSEALTLIDDIVGWMYFLAWSVSFYPQVYENWKRKSVIGLNFDFLALNLLGFFLYSLFNIGLMWIQPIKEEYFALHPTGVDPVQANDVFFSVHAVLICLFTIYQCRIYETGGQTVSRSCRIILALLGSLLAFVLILPALEWLDFLYACSYAKLFITLVKYVPQAVMNYRRKSTMGWSIGNVLLDCTGGVLSVAQMFIIAYNEDDWSSIFGDPTKFGLGLFSILFDVFFMLQHYVFYRGGVAERLELFNEEDEENPDDDTNSLHGLSSFDGDIEEQQ